MKLPRYSLLGLLVCVTITSFFMGFAKLLGIQPAAIAFIGASAIVTLTVAFRVFFLNR